MTHLSPAVMQRRTAMPQSRFPWQVRAPLGLPCKCGMARSCPACAPWHVPLLLVNGVPQNDGYASTP